MGKLNNSEIRIENSSLCNGRCTICPRDKMTRKKVIMPNSHFKYLVNQAVNLGAETISVFGFGEPLMDKDVAKKVAYCTNKGLKTFVTTNGTLLDLNMAYALIKAGLSHIRFSVHGLHNTYGKVHLGFDFDDVVRKIMNFKAVTRKYGPCKVSISSIPMNGEDIEDIKNFWQGFELEVWKPHNWSGAKKYRTIVRKKKTCGRPTNGPIQINADGTMMVCCYDTDAKMIVGDTYKNSIEEILRGRIYDYIRTCHKLGRLDGLPCETCDQLNENDHPLLYSTIDPTCQIDKTSSTKFALTGT